MTKVREVMTSGIELVDADSTLAEAAAAMSRLEVDAVPVADAAGEVRGILTSHHIAVRCLALSADPYTVLARQCADGSPVTVRANDSVEDAVARMAENHAARLLVLSGSDVVGIMTIDELASELPPDEYAQAMHAVEPEHEARQRLRNQTNGGAQPFFGFFFDRIGGLGRKKSERGGRRTRQ